MKLHVFFGTVKCGCLSSTDNRGVVFSYDEEYLSNPEAKRISISLPLQHEEFSKKQCLPFFSGLIPEEATRKRVADYLHISEFSTVKLLEALGQECAGYITIANEEFNPACLKNEYEITSSNYEKLSLSQLETYVENIPQRPFIKAEDKLRLSLAGAQEKLALAYFDGQWYLPLDGAPSTHILKPTREGNLSSLAKNEYLCMKLAKECGLDAPEVQLTTLAGKDIYIVQRYDRIIDDNKVSRLHQEDMCQALRIMPDQKYQSDGGAGIVAIYNLIKQNSIIPVLDLQAFLNQVVFNFLIGNCDAHSKNYSILYNTNGKACLSPIYDAVSTTCYPALSKKLSMKIGQHYEIDKVNQDDINLLADSINLNPKRLTKIVTEMKEKIHNSDYWKELQDLKQAE